MTEGNPLGFPDRRRNQKASLRTGAFEFNLAIELKSCHLTVSFENTLANNQMLL